MRLRQLRATATAVATAAATATAGASQPAASQPAVSLGANIGPGEGELNLVIWAGYAERGASDPTYDWVTPFETLTGCKVNSTDMTDSNNGVSLIQSGAYDGISASGDATTRLIQGGLVAPIDTSVFANYANVFDSLKNLPHNTVDGVNYGVPHGRGANLLAYNTDKVTPAPTSWAPIWEDGAQLQGQDQHLRLVDLHRRRRAASQDDPPGAGHQGHLSAQRRRSSTQPSTCSRRSTRTIRCTGALPRTRSSRIHVR